MMRFLFIISFFTSCNSNYSGGNIGSILLVETNMNLETLTAVTDSLTSAGRFAVPEELYQKMNMAGYSFLNHKNYYLTNYPKQVYVVTYSGSILVRMIYDVEKNEWLTKDSEITKDELIKIESRFEIEVLAELLKEARRLNIADSLIFYQTGLTTPSEE